MVKCVCTKFNMQTRCINKLCYKCCKKKDTFNNCIVHNNKTTILCKCNKLADKKCVNNSCYDCCLQIKDICMKHKNPNLCKCGNLYSPYCIKNGCKNCCSGKDCQAHEYKLKLCNCGKTNFDIECIERVCIQCCKNDLCEKHFIFCKCKINKINIDTYCTTKSCSGKCCYDSHCSFHFDTDENMSLKELNNYKILLLSRNKIKLSIEIINIIIDDFLDNRIKCIICNNKYSLDDAVCIGDIEQCESCNNWMCFEICCNEYYSKSSFYKWCINCSENLSNTDKIINSDNSIDYSSDNSIDNLNDNLIDYFSDNLIDYFSDNLIDYPIDNLIDYTSDSLIDYPSDNSSDNSSNT